MEDASGKKVDEDFPNGISRMRNAIVEKIVADVMSQMMRGIDERIVADATIQRKGSVQKNAGVTIQGLVTVVD